MQFETVNGLAIKSKFLGLWKPLFKYRFKNNYLDNVDYNTFEKELFERIFGQTDEKIIMRANTYPFDLGNEHFEQFIIWVRNIEDDPGIEYIYQKFLEKFPKNDLNIYINGASSRSIKNILHYHAIIKAPSPTTILPKLTKLIVWFRHANRYPTKQFTNIKIHSDHTKYVTKDAPLIDSIGFINAKKFGSELKNIYELSDDFVSDIISISSPYTRCIQTIQQVLLGLNVISEIKIIEQLQMSEFKDIQSELNKISFDDYHHKLLNKLSTDLEWKSNKMIDLYSIHSTIKCYEDLNIDILDSSTKKLLDQSTKSINNVSGTLDQKINSDAIKNIIKLTTNFDHKLILCSAHDHLIFTLAKYFAIKNNIENDLDLPHYMSNVRIEYWSDQVVRIYYGNCFIGSVV